MPCYYPLKGWRSRRANPNGKRSIVFHKNAGFSDQSVEIPCGCCIGCRLEYSRQWAMRCMHEAQMHDNNCFITLTYADEYLPDYRSLVKKDFQKFMKRLRKKFGAGIRFYACGEYGDQYERPHYHACIFGHDFADKVLWKTRDEISLYVSEALNELWPFGFATIGALTFESAAYTARYCVKKHKGKNWKTKYDRVDEETGEIITLTPEFALMSRKPGIGSTWYDEFNPEVFPLDRVVINAREVKPPKFYINKLEKLMPKKFAEVKAARQKFAKENPKTLARLNVSRIVKEAQLKQLKRSL